MSHVDSKDIRQLIDVEERWRPISIVKVAGASDPGGLHLQTSADVRDEGIPFELSSFIDGRGS